MTLLRMLYHVARADFLERIRRYSYLVTLAATVWLAYLVATGVVRVALDDYRGVFNSAWIGSMLTLIAVTFLTLAGFYIVKNCIVRDAQTRVGQVLATTPIPRSLYTLGKALSNFALLASMLAVLFLAGIYMQLTKGEDANLDLVKLAAPMVLVGLPALALVGSVSILFETLPLLRGALGNFAAFFLWLFGMVGAIEGSKYDFLGMGIFCNSMVDAVRKVHPSFKYGLNIGNNGRALKGTFLYEGVPWDQAVITSRLSVLLVAGAVAVLAGLFFHRFDPAKMKLNAGGWWTRLRQRSGQAIEEQNGNGGPAGAPSVHLTPIPALSGKISFSEMRFSQLFIAELKMMLKGHSKFWYLVAAGLFIATLFNNTENGLRILTCLWLWSLLMWSRMGTREATCNTEKFMFSSPHVHLRQLPATWGAAAILAVMMGSAIILKLVTAGNLRGVMALLAGAMAMPAFAMACGTLTGTSKLFEALAVVLWYTGPMQKEPLLDFVGASPATLHGNTPEYLFLTAAACMAVTYVARQRSRWAGVWLKAAA